MPSLEELVSSEESQSPRPFRWWRVAILAALLVLLLMAIFLPPLINLGKYRRSITASMSEALGRPVYVGGMQLRLLPMPGIVMTDFTVDEDPSFGYEPVLHASDVVASLRISSLWRGRLEVSRISLDEANLNLVRNTAGQWNIGSVLERASQIPNAPTGQRHASARPRFPYIEATNARIDFKDGVEKRPFSLMNAEFSMWQAGRDEWQLRLRAQPVRTDLQLHLYDTGEVRVEGSMQRASALNGIPVDLRAEWSGAQLGQVTRLFAGIDSGWRGDLDVTTRIRGNLGDLRLESRVRVGDLRRQEFQPPSPMQVDANCRSEYHRTAHLFDNITCFWPAGKGHLLLTGRVQGFEAPRADLQLEINQVPASFPVEMLELIRPGAQNVSVSGVVNGNFQLVKTDQALVSGSAEATGVSLRYSGGTLNLPAMRFVAPPPEPPTPHRAKHAVPPPAAPGPNAIQLLPLSVAMGEPQPLVVETRLSRAGFEIHLNGQAALARLFPAVANFGALENATALVAPRGRATLNLTTTGAWMRPLSGPGNGLSTTGTIALESAQLRPTFLPAPVDVQSAEVELGTQQIAWQNVAFIYRKTPMQGSLQFPVVCGAPGGCPALFTLGMGPTSGAAIEAALGAIPDNGFLDRLLSFGDNRAGWPTLQGTIRCEQLDLGPLALRDVAATVSVAGGTLTLSSLDAAALGGTTHWSGEMHIEGGTPHWKLKIRAAGANAVAAAHLFDEHWGPGELSGEASLSMKGLRAADLASSAAGDFAFTWQNGGLAKTGAGEVSALAQFSHWTGKGSVVGNALEITGGGVTRAGRTNAVHGSISFDRDLNLTVETRRGPEKIKGTLARPIVSAAGSR